jgi:hypothetical protein
MLIDPNPQTRSPAAQVSPNGQASPNAQASLSPELAKLVADLKLSVGQSLEALVTRVQVVSEAERQELLSLQPAAPKNQAQRQMQALLQEPALKLVELKIQQSLVPTLTALPLVKTQALQVLLTTRGLMLVPPPQQQPAAPSDIAEVLLRQTPVATTGAPATNVRVGTAPSTLPTPGQIPPAALTKLVENPDLPPARPNTSIPAPPSGSPSPKSPIAGGAGSPQPDSFLLKPGVPITDAAPVGKPPNTVPADPIPASAVRSLVAETLARTLPQSQELPPLLHALSQLNRQLQALQPEKLPPEIRQLQTLLNKLPGLSLNLAQLDPTRPQPLQQALERSGAFYEHRLLQSLETGTEQATRKLPEQDLKGLLIQIQQWLASPTAPIQNRPQMTDTLSQLLFGLVQVFLPHQKPRPDTSALQQLKSAVQQRVEQGLARIQTQQMRTLSSQLLDPATPQQWHLDIPLRLPEGYGNLYLHLFEPRLPPEPDREPGKKEQRRQRKGRWRVFLELDIDELGGLAAEISVLEQDLEITLWAERDSLRERANAHLRELKRDLEQQGMVVRELQCSQNPPPAQKVQLDYALIDVKT